MSGFEVLVFMMTQLCKIDIIFLLIVEIAGMYLESIGEGKREKVQQYQWD